MLVLRVTMIEGRSLEQKTQLIRRLSEAAAHHFDMPLDEVRLIIYEVPATHWGVGGRSVAEREREKHGVSIL